LTIKDEGIGIPEYDIGKVFEPFFTGDNGRKGYHSSGIGLYFCKEVCNMLGHSINISSGHNEGTSVKITYLAKL
jgi:signal transduction histidine kinase